MTGTGDTSLTLAGEPTVEHLDHEVLNGHRFADGQGFPQSYRRFVENVGWGRAFGLWLIYPPVLDGYADGWQGRAANLTARFRSVYQDGQREGYDWMVEPDGSWDLCSGLEVFGWSENGDGLLWQPAARSPDGELPVWESRGIDSLHLLGPDLDTALAVLRTRTRASLGPRTHDVEPLPAVRL
ncbi:hypothetical protein NODU109028_16680 [Nocardioides dubius]|uniref:SMI1/KNR4 family protein n=1 Tax=Nocardioides dubius TaxID=317019 RepID=A0ABN1TWI6_9ACTN